MAVKLMNISRRIQTFNLEAPHFVQSEGENGKGKPESVTFLPREVKTLHDAALDCVQIKNALASHENKPTLRVVQ